jgi:hypothetical protein
VVRRITEAAAVEAIPVGLADAALKPAALKFVLLEPALPERVVLKPAALKPAVLKPAVPERAVLERAVLKPAVLKPAVPEPAPLEPAVAALPTLCSAVLRRTVPRAAGEPAARPAEAPMGCAVVWRPGCTPGAGAAGRYRGRTLPPTCRRIGASGMCCLPAPGWLVRIASGPVAARRRLTVRSATGSAAESAFAVPGTIARSTRPDPAANHDWPGAEAAAECATPMAGAPPLPTEVRLAEVWLAEVWLAELWWAELWWAELWWAELWWAELWWAELWWAELWWAELW